MPPGVHDHMNENVLESCIHCGRPHGVSLPSPLSHLSQHSPALAGGGWGTVLALAGGMAMRGALESLSLFSLAVLGTRVSLSDHCL